VSDIHTLGSLQDVLDLVGPHPVLTLDIGDGFRAPAYAARSGTGWTVAFHRRSDHGIRGSAVIGTAEGLSTLLDDAEVRAWVTGGGNRHLSVPRGTIDVVQARLDLGTRGGDWDWLWTTAAPEEVVGEHLVAPLPPACRDEAEGFLDEHSPRTHGQPFARPSQHWVAVREPADGSLVAIGCSEPGAGGTPTLAGIAVARERRGEGWGAAVTAHLTRRGVQSHGACVLGMFADNAPARGLYHRLGFGTGMEWTSRWFG